MRRTVCLVALVAALLAACVPPPPRPPTLAGDPHFQGEQALIHLICNTKGCVPDCMLHLETSIDLYYVKARIISRIYATGGCSVSDWTSISATTRCTILLGTRPSCGSVPLWISTNRFQNWLIFEPTPGIGQLTTTFSGTYHGQPASPAVGDTPPFKCSPDLHQCKFQV
jgi:hypothetical protein